MNTASALIRRILVIDDNPEIHGDFLKVLSPETAPSSELLNLTASIFGGERAAERKIQYEVSFAQRGQDGVQMAQNAQNENRHFALAFIDMRMPNGWNGLETIQEIWKIQPDLQIVLCTAFSDFTWEEIREKLAYSDRFFILKKPFDSIEVQQLTDALISRQSAEDSLIENEAILTIAQDVGQIGHYTLEFDSKITARSKKLESILGIRSDFAFDIGALFSLIDIPYRNQLLENIDKALISQKRFEMVCKFTRWSDQNPCWALASGHWEYGQNGSPTRLIGTVQDISLRHALQDELRLLNACISQVKDVVIVTDSGSNSIDGPKIVFVNDAFSSKTGYSREEVIGKSPKILQGPKTQKATLQAIKQSIRQNKPIRGELINYSRDGKEYWVDLTLTPVKDAEGNYSHWVGVQRDVSTESVLNAIEVVHQGSTWVSPDATEQILTQIAEATIPAELSPEQQKLASLSKKEKQIAMAIMNHAESSRKEFAGQLNISEHTLRNHLASIYEKLNIHSRLEMYVFCKKYMKGLTDPDSSSE